MIAINVTQNPTATSERYTENTTMGAACRCVISPVSRIVPQEQFGFKTASNFG
jgi:hypothetical protein